jgi:hypothetical protein
MKTNEEESARKGRTRTTYLHTLVNQACRRLHTNTATDKEAWDKI